jgi:hypothetical protein
MLSESSRKYAFSSRAKAALELSLSLMQLALLAVRSDRSSRDICLLGRISLRTLIELAAFAFEFACADERDIQMRAKTRKACQEG